MFRRILFTFRTFRALDDSVYLCGADGAARSRKMRYGTHVPSFVHANLFAAPLSSEEIDQVGPRGKSELCEATARRFVTCNFGRKQVM